MARTRLFPRGCLPIPGVEQVEFCAFFLYVLDDILNLESQAPMEIIKEKTIAFTGNRSLTSPSGLRGTQLERAIFNKLYELLEKEYLGNGITTYSFLEAIGVMNNHAEECFRHASHTVKFEKILYFLISSNLTIVLLCFQCL